MSQLRQLQHSQSQSVEVLRGAAGDTLDLSEGGFSSFVWETEERRALDLELRIRIVAVKDTAPYVVPNVQYRLDFGHGDKSWKVPPLAAVPTLGTLQATMFLPARGIVLRLSARQLQVDVKNLVTTQLVKVDVSVQPSRAPISAIPYVQLGTDNWLPMDARYLRVRQPSGSVFAAAAATIQFFTLNGQALTLPVDPTTTGWSEYQPIPPQAAFVRTSVSALFDYL